MKGSSLLVNPSQGRRNTGALTEDQIKSLSAFFANRQGVVLAYLFGSQVAGRVGPLSDVDIAVLLHERIPPDQYGHIKIALISDLMRLLRRDDVDVVILNRADLILCHQVVKNGRLLHCADEDVRVKFTFETYRDYLDHLPMCREFAKGMRDRLEEGRFGHSRARHTAALHET